MASATPGGVHLTAQNGGDERFVDSSVSDRPEH